MSKAAERLRAAQEKVKGNTGSAEKVSAADRLKAAQDQVKAEKLKTAPKPFNTEPVETPSLQTDRNVKREQNLYAQQREQERETMGGKEDKKPEIRAGSWGSGGVKTYQHGFPKVRSLPSPQRLR
jgi:hypothetical protein